MRLQGRRAIVTGGTSGIGEAMVHRFAREGASVVFCGRDEQAGARVEGAVRGDGGTAEFIPCDVTDRAAVDALVAASVSRLGGLEVVVANAGTGAGEAWPDESDETWHGILSLNLDGLMYLARAAWPHLLEAGGSGDASLVAISSLSAWMGVGRDQLDKMGGQPSASYQASKAAMEGLVVHLAGRGGEHNVRVNAVRPGRILTERFRQWLGEDGVFWNHYREAQLLKRHGHVDDVVNATLFLASDESSFITGTVLDVNGGAIVKL